MYDSVHDPIQVGKISLYQGPYIPDNIKGLVSKYHLSVPPPLTIAIQYSNAQEKIVYNYMGQFTRKLHHSYGTVSAEIAPRLKCYKNASRLNRYNIPTDNALFSTLHTTPFHYEVLKIGSR